MAFLSAEFCEKKQLIITIITMITIMLHYFPDMTSIGEHLPTKTATKSWVFCCIFGLFFLNFFVSFPLFSLFSAVSCHLGTPKTAHHMRLQAYIYIWPYIYTYIYIYRRVTPLSTFTPFQSYPTTHVRVTPPSTSILH